MTAPDRGESAAVPGTVEEPELTTGGAPNSLADLPSLTGQSRVWFDRAAALHNGGRPSQAAELLCRALMLEPTFACLREALGRAQFDAKQLLAARMTFSAMTALNPLDHYAHFGLGLTRAELGDLAGAIRALERGVALAPDEIKYLVALEHLRVATTRDAGARKS